MYARIIMFDLFIEKSSAIGLEISLEIVRKRAEALLVALNKHGTKKVSRVKQARYE